MNATTGTGKFVNIPDCYIQIGSQEPIYMYIMPDIGDQHEAKYNTQDGIGRSMPMYTFAFGGVRSISWTIHLYADSLDRLISNLQVLRRIEACTYPRVDQVKDLPFTPPSICRLKCGEVLGSPTYEISAVLKSYNVKFPVDVQWSGPISYKGQNYSSIPYKFDIDCSFEVVYSAGTLPGAERIVQFGN